MEFLILGPTVFLVAGRPVPLGPAKQRAFLAVLLLHASSPVPMEVIVDYLWHGQRVDACRGKLHPLVSRTRAQLRDAGLPSVLLRDGTLDAYRLDVDPYSVDLHGFGHMLREARVASQHERPDQAVALLADAVRLWRGAPLAEARGARVEHLRRDLEVTLLDAKRILADSLLAIHRHEDALALLQPLVSANPLDDALADLWVRALKSMGREGEARAFVHQFQRRYRRKIGADPVVDLIGLVGGSQKVGSSRANGGPKVVANTSPPVAPPQQLPADLHDFTGRTALIADLDRLVDEPIAGGPRVIVLTGPPGVGKTTIARHWAVRQQQRFPDGQLYLNCDGHSDNPTVRPEDALHGFLTAFGVPPDQIPNGVARRRERFNHLLRHRRVLIWLDNVLDSEQARSLLSASPTCVTIITSRNRLTDLAISDGIGGIDVPTLPVADQLALLSRIVGNARPDARPATLRALASLSAGFPLALRIIGEHVVARPRASIDELAVELSTRLLDCEAGEDPDATLRTVFAWSHQALQPTTARLFHLLGLFSGTTVDAGAAGALLGVGHERAERELDILARAHLINHDTARRYRMHDLLRRYAADCGRTVEPDDERRAALRRLLDWYLLSAVNAATLLAPDQSSVPDLPMVGESPPMIFATDIEAMKWCETERRNLIELVRVAVAHGFHRHGWQIPGAVHEAFDRSGSQDDLLKMLQMALVAVELDGHPLGRFGTLVNLGATHFALRDYREAIRRYEEAGDLVHLTRDPSNEALYLHNLAAVYLRTGRPDEAVATFNRALEICERVGDARGRAYNLRELAGAYGQGRRYAEAERCYLDALGAWQRIGSPRHQAITHSRLARLYLRMGQPQAALAHCGQGRALHRRVRDEPNLCDVLTTLADTSRMTGRYAKAVTNASAAIDLADAIADPIRQARALAVLADTQAAVGDGATAYERCQEGLELVDDVDDPEVHEVLDRLLAVEARVAWRAEAG